MLGENDALRRAEVIDDGDTAAVAVERGHGLGDVELRLWSGSQLLRHGRYITQRRLNDPHQFVEARLDFFKRRVSSLKSASKKSIIIIQ